MIRIEGIPIVAARLAVMLKSTKAIEPARPARPIPYTDGEVINKQTLGLHGGR